MNVSAIVPAAGLGTRMGKAAGKRYGSTRKQFMKVGGTPILALTVRKFLAVDSIREILVAVPEGSEESARAMLPGTGGSGRVRILAGGRNRQESVGRCVDALSEETDLVVVHDGVRPFIPVRLVEDAIRKAAVHRAVILGMPAEETVKQVSRRVVQATLPRERIMLVQTPQVFAFDLLSRAFEKARQDGFVGTDEASLVEHLNEDVYLMRGSERNIKITGPHHMALAQLYLEQENRETASDRRV